MGILSIEGDRIEGRRQPLRRRLRRQIVEPPIGLFGRALAGEHPGRVLLAPLEGEDPRGVGELTGDVLLEQPLQTITPRSIAGQGDPGHPGVAECLLMQRHPDLVASHVVDELLPAVLGEHPLPVLEGPSVLGVELLAGNGRHPRDVHPGLRRAMQLVEGLGHHRLLLGPGVVLADRRHHLSQVPGSLGGHHMSLGGVTGGQIDRGLQAQPLLPESAHQCLVEPIGPRVVEV